jgi:hypothetical protein
LESLTTLPLLTVLAAPTLGLLRAVRLPVVPIVALLSALTVRLMRFRLLLTFFSGCLTIDLEFLTTLALLLCTVLAVLTFGLLRPVRFPVATTVALLSTLILRLLLTFFSGCLTIDLEFFTTLVLLLLTALAIPTFDLLRLVRFPVLLTEVATREVLPELIRLPEPVAVPFPTRELTSTDLLTRT